MSKFLGFRVINLDIYNYLKTFSKENIIKFWRYDVYKIRMVDQDAYVCDISKSDWNDIPEATRNLLSLYMIQDD